MSRHQAAREALIEALTDDDPEVLYQRAPCGFLSVTPTGTIVKVNDTFLTWTGFQRDDLVGRRRFVDLLTPGGKLYHETHYMPLLQMQGQVREVALEVVVADGERMPTLVNAALERNADGDPRVIRIVVFDATERRRYERELLLAKQRAEASEGQARELAQTLQRTLLPPSTPIIPGLEVAAAFRPAGEGADVGGDFYDAFQVGQDDWVVVLGDVCGKGVEAAVVTALVRHTLRAVVIGLHEPGQALQVLNEALLAQADGRFCTVVMARLQRDADGWRATLGSGGHPAPLLRRPGRPVEPVNGQGPLIGVLESVEFRDRVVRLEPGDVLTLFTDGVTEARRNGELYGDARLRASVERSDASAVAVVEAILDDVDAFQRGSLRDDVALVSLRVLDS
ncbi:MAG TPA: SpoIIE family protein phosphatase [Nocardioides sp.]|uniref:SpoIIE family protein phosphatase n=1 Tax=Nocardioides sp. TaxID=35761 RepID=UPI002D7ED1E3|nr:SpoIIE family protein phosphatase [Nocardioides sp.]HET6652240.1 SpoIIE family protein phosphatase [Nocardioides sp.]